MAEKDKNRIGEPFTHFVSLEVKTDLDHRNFMSQVEGFQAKTLSLFPSKQGKPAKMSSLHITLATLSVQEDEMAALIQAIGTSVDHFKRVYAGEDGIRCDFQGISTAGDIIYLEMALGNNACKTLRSILLANGLSTFLTDHNQTPHMTYMRRMVLDDIEKSAVQAMMNGDKTSRVTLDTLSLRERKTGSTLQPPVKVFDLWRD